MKLAPLLLTTAFLLSGATFFNAQETKCTLKINQAPELRGFRLGMTVEEVKTRIPVIQVINQNEFGSSYGSLNGHTLRKLDEATYKNIGEVYFSFFDGRAVGVTLSYDGVIWRSTDEFIAKVTQAFKLPNVWEGDGQKLLQCDGWKIQASASGSTARLSLIGPSVTQTVRRRQEEYEEKQRQSFKP